MIKIVNNKTEQKWIAAPQGGNPLPGEVLGIVYLPDGFSFLLQGNGPAEKWNAYCRLVAAAPELLAACERLLEAVKTDWSDEIAEALLEKDIVTQAAQAIAKAKGEKA